MSWSPLWAAMTSLRAKYIRDLAIRGRATRTQQSYTSYVADLARHYRRSPDQISYEEVADWPHYLIQERHQSASSVNIAVNAVRFLYGVTLGRDVQALLASVPRMKRNTRRAPVYALANWKPSSPPRSYPATAPSSWPCTPAACSSLKPPIAKPPTAPATHAMARATRRKTRPRQSLAVPGRASPPAHQPEHRPEHLLPGPQKRCCTAHTRSLHRLVRNSTIHHAKLCGQNLRTRSDRRRCHVASKLTTDATDGHG